MKLNFSIGCLLVVMVQAQDRGEFTDYLSRMTSEFEVNQLASDSLDMRKMILLDTREREEFDVSHIEHAVWIGYDDFDFSRLESLAHTDTLVVYCSVGYRSNKLAEKLIEEGYVNVYNLYGGIFKWVNEKRKVVKNGIETQQIHAFNLYWGRFLTNPELNKIY